MEAYWSAAQWALRSCLLNPTGNTELWLKLLVSLLAGAALLNFVCGIFKMGNPSFTTAIVLFTFLSALMVAAVAVLHVHAGHLFRGQDRWVGFVVWSTAACLLLVAPILKSAWPGGYFSAIISWGVSWGGVLLILLVLGGFFSAIGAGKNVVRKENARTTETREMLDLRP